MRGVRTAGLCSQRTNFLGHQGAKTREKHPKRELTNVGARFDTPILDLHCAARLWRNRDCQKSLFLASAPQISYPLHIQTVKPRTTASSSALPVQSIDRFRHLPKLKV